eukprot:CCRYP_013905-RA/>CCRYP_013905-RA protein AED:0.06 eAED:0.06 QI:244/1/1/1/1/1/3/248/749
MIHNNARIASMTAKLPLLALALLTTLGDASISERLTSSRRGLTPSLIKLDRNRSSKRLHYLVSFRGGDADDDRTGQEEPLNESLLEGDVNDSSDGSSGNVPKKKSPWSSFLTKKQPPSTRTDNVNDNTQSGHVEFTLNSDGQTINVEVDAPNLPEKIKNDILHSLQEPDGNYNNSNNNESTAASDREKNTPFSLLSNGIVANGGSATPSNHVLSSKFPIARDELPHFASMSVLMFLFIYVFTTVRDTKDTLVVSNCGAEAIPFLKLYGVMPSAALFILAYSKAANVLSKSGLFYCTLIPFFVFYLVFGWVLFPNRERIHLLGEGFLGGGGSGGDGAASAAVNLIRYWSFSLYFIVSELWASAGVPLLFWQCANDVTPMSQAKRFYPLFAITGNLAPIVSGKIMSYVISLQKNNDDVGFGSTLKTLSVIKGLVCLGIIAIYRHVYAMADERSRRERTEQSLSTIRGIQRTGKVEITMKFEKKKEKLSLADSAKELMKSKELKAMAAMVFCYNVCVELTEVLWKALLRRTYPTKSEYMAYMARFSQTVGVVAFLLQLVASEILEVLGWKWTAMIPPLTMGLLAVAFFAAIVAGEEKIPLAQALLIGTVQNVANKVTKYSLFDPCKEMAYIPLGPEAKVKGKAAIDVLGARLGRSIGSASQQLLVLLAGGPTGSILNCAPYIGGLYVAAIALWSNAVGVLGQLFDESQKEKKVDNTEKLAAIGQAITIIKSVEDAKREKKKVAAQKEKGGKK